MVPEEKFSIDDLYGNQRAIAEVIGIEAYIKLAKAFGGDDSLYVQSLINSKISKEIKRLFPSLTDTIISV